MPSGAVVMAVGVMAAEADTAAVADTPLVPAATSAEGA
jgi:hypothetical protein